MPLATLNPSGTSTFLRLPSPFYSLPFYKIPYSLFRPFHSISAFYSVLCSILGSFLGVLRNLLIHSVQHNKLYATSLYYNPATLIG